jgi:hypothetical protein
MFRWTAMFLLFPFFMQGQDLSAAEFFKYDTIPALYLGIDFTQAKLINDEVSNENIIQERQFNGINDLMIKEYKKYDFQKAYRRITWNVDISEVEKRNQDVNPGQLKSLNDSDLHRMRKPDVERLVSGFNFGTHKGYGVLLVVQGMDKSSKLITIWYTLVDMEAKKVLFTYLLQGGVGGGFGFRNYWSSAIKSTITYVKNKSYDEWKERFGVK